MPFFNQTERALFSLGSMMLLLPVLIVLGAIFAAILLSAGPIISVGFLLIAAVWVAASVRSRRPPAPPAAAASATPPSPAAASVSASGRFLTVELPPLGPERARPVSPS